MANDVSLVEVMARLVAAFALIIGMLGGAVYVFRRRGMLRVLPGAAAPQKRMRVVERQTLSRSSSVALVRVGTRAYLVGATDASVTLLADVSETVAEADDADAALATDTALHTQDGSSRTPDGTRRRHANTDPAHQGTGAAAGGGPLQSARMDVVGAILQRMTRRA
jgi:flagellar protein FliO/FliZ